MDELTPKNAKQKHMIQILLAKMQGIDVEFYDRLDKRWMVSTTCAVVADGKYRIKSHKLPITRKIWRTIGKKWKWAAKDYSGEVFFYIKKPIKSNGYWLAVSGRSFSRTLALKEDLNVDDIDWQKSLTKRPEGV